MISSLVAWLFNLAARLPLRVLHRLGAVVGKLTYSLSNKYAERMRENLSYAWKGRPEADFNKVLNASIVEAGKGAVELLWVWCQPLAEVTASVKACYGWEHIEAARARGKGIIFLTPHLGCFDVSALYVAEHMPLTVLYRPPKLIWLERVMRSGRERAQVIPGNGEGEWADFFGRPAYTMTLIGRLLKSSGASVVMTSVERLTYGSGYILRFTPLEFVDDLPISRQINAALEKLVLINPAQYLWSYNRYKTPAGIKPATEQEAHPT
ncbi:MAG: lipid A biosynthesis acyltransferase [Proteobacteria bacterium]|nr:lipid A biosynthesis acyltransferase [Pseudomonadota bacterium]